MYARVVDPISRVWAGATEIPFDLPKIRNDRGLIDRNRTRIAYAGLLPARKGTRFFPVQPIPCGLLRKYSRLPSAASASWSIAMIIACTWW
jgi:hypothetical protein